MILLRGIVPFRVKMKKRSFFVFVQFFRVKQATKPMIFEFLARGFFKRKSVSGTLNRQFSIHRTSAFSAFEVTICHFNIKNEKHLKFLLC